MNIKTILYTMLIAAVAVVTACEKDNYEAPKSILNGRILYNDQSIGVRSNAVQLELWQHGYDFFTKIPVYVNQDGTFSARLFDGDYKLTMAGGTPWLFKTDSIDVKVKGNTIIDFPVTPYTFVKNATYQKSGNNIVATVNLQTVSTAQPLESVKLYISRTILADEIQKDGVTVLEASAITDINAAQTLSVAIPSSLASLDAVYVRVGVKVAGVAEITYSPAEKVQIK